MSPEDYNAMVERAKEYILAGDIFQVVLSQRFETPFALPPFALYRALRRTNPSPFLFFLDFGDFAVVGSSPEILVRLRDDDGHDPADRRHPAARRDAAEDKALAEDMLADPKELAEHLMLLDLGRNDVGRVAKIGTVEVTEQNIVEYYSHVMHIVSNVEAKLAAAGGRAGRPDRRLSGRHRLGRARRSAPWRSSTSWSPCGAASMRAASAISAPTAPWTPASRCAAVVKDGSMYIQAGAGIVADSDPDAEHVECLNKARALVRAAQEAVRFSARHG